MFIFSFLINLNAKYFLQQTVYQELIVLVLASVFLTKLHDISRWYISVPGRGA